MKFVMVFLCLVSTAQAETITSDWFLKEKRDGLTIGIEELHSLLEIGFEVTEKEKKKVVEQKFALSLTLSFTETWELGVDDYAPCVTLGVGLGLKAELEWRTTTYNLILAEIDYPSLDADTYLYVQWLAKIEMGFGSLIFRFRAGEVVETSIGLGVKW